MPWSPPDLLTLHATANPAKIAVIEDRPDGTWLRWSYAELEERSNRLANALLAHGVGARDRVIWCGPNSPGVVVMTHAARKLSATAVPLNYRFTPDEAAYVVDNCDAVFAWVDADQAALFAEIRPRCPKLRQVAIFGGRPGAGQLDGEQLLAAASAAPPARPADEPQTMIYTSGTTGHPKGAVRSGIGDPEQVRALTGFIGYRPDDVYAADGQRQDPEAAATRAVLGGPRSSGGMR